MLLLEKVASAAKMTVVFIMARSKGELLFIIENIKKKNNTTTFIRLFLDVHKYKTKFSDN